MTTRNILAALPLTLFAGAAFAHPGHDSASFFSGLGHPLGGLDHLLAMVAVGLLAARQAGVSRWALPAAFVIAMLAGAGLSGLGVALPVVEAGIAASVLVLGVLIAFVVRLRLAVAMPMVAVFALFHGHAHFAEMGDASALAYSVGFIVATAALHVAGYLAGRSLPEAGWAGVVRRAVGGLIAATGALMLVVGG